MSEFTFSDGSFEQDVLKSKGVVMVDFFAVWCGPCKMMAPSIEKLAEEYKGKARIGKLNVDDNAETSTRYEIQSIPTIIFFKDGEMVDKLVGFQSAEVLKQKLDSFM